MNVLVDTNIVLRINGIGHPGNAAVSETLARSTAAGDRLCIGQQSLVEAWAVMTRSMKANGLDLAPSQARAEVDRITATFTLLPDPPTLFSTWLDLCTTHEVRGRQAFDARLVALMVGSGITRFVTLNPVDFKRYPMIEVMVPGGEATGS